MEALIDVTELPSIAGPQRIVSTESVTFWGNFVHRLPRGDMSAAESKTDGRAPKP